MFGTGNPTPYDLPLLVALIAIALLLIAGAFTAPAWAPGVGVWVRRVSLATAAAALLVVLLLSPTRDGIVGAGRLLTIWPAFVIDVAAFLVWSWRAGRL